MNDMIAGIIVDSKSKQLDRVFDYLVPKELSDEIQIGSRVLVPFSAGNRETEGFCVSLSAAQPPKSLKSVIAIAGDKPAFDSDMLELIEWMHEKYLSSYIDIIHSIVPAGTSLKSREIIVLCDGADDGISKGQSEIIQILSENGGRMEYERLKERVGGDIQSRIRLMASKDLVRREYVSKAAVKDKNIRYIRLRISAEEAQKELDGLNKRAVKQRALLGALIERERMPSSEAARIAGGGDPLKALEKKGITEFYNVRVERDPFLHRSFDKSEKMMPTFEQKKAIDRINSAIRSADGQEFLLHGVTGSGKTEVFLQTIEYALSIGKTAIVLVPEISLTPQTVSRFKSRFSDRIAIFHSALSQGERYDQWRKIKDGGADIVIGARSAVFAPLENIGIIIMDEEHSDTYKSEMSPRYHAREVASFRAKQHGASLVLASATPSIESMHRAKENKYALLEMRSRFNNNSMPEIYVEDMRSELARGNRSMLSARLYREIYSNLQKGEQTILFLNRRGFSSFVSCRTCGYVPECENCSISLTYHKTDRDLKCHYCGYTRPNYSVCPVCGSIYIRYFGGGTQRVEDEIKRFFPKASMLRMDMDTTGKKQSHEKILARFEREKIDLLIGTQMVAKGLDFENVTLVGVISADTMLHMNDYRSAERTFALLEQVSGRAGRGSKEGRAVIQTYTPEHEAVRLVKTHDYNSFYDAEIAQRRLLWYPPFCSMVGVYFQSDDEEKTRRTALYFAKAVGDPSKLSQRVQVLGPIPAYISKINNKYRYQIIFKCEDDDALGSVLYEAERDCRENKECRGVSIVIDKAPAMIY